MSAQLRSLWPGFLCLWCPHWPGDTEPASHILARSQDPVCRECVSAVYPRSAPSALSCRRPLPTHSVRAISPSVARCRASSNGGGGVREDIRRRPAACVDCFRRRVQRRCRGSGRLWQVSCLAFLHPGSSAALRHRCSARDGVDVGGSRSDRRAVLPLAPWHLDHRLFQGAHAGASYEEAPPEDQAGAVTCCGRR